MVFHCMTVVCLRNGTMSSGSQKGPVIFRKTLKEEEPLAKGEIYRVGWWTDVFYFLVIFVSPRLVFTLILLVSTIWLLFFERP